MTIAYTLVQVSMSDCFICAAQMTKSLRPNISPSSSVFAALKDLGVIPEIIECDPELSDTQVFCEHYGYSLEESANVIVAVGNQNPGSL